MQQFLYFCNYCVIDEEFSFFALLFFEGLIIRLCFKIQKQPLKVVFRVSDKYAKSPNPVKKPIFGIGG